MAYRRGSFAFCTTRVFGCALMNATTTASQIARLTSGRVREVTYLKTGLPEMHVFSMLLAHVLDDVLCG